MFLLTAQGPRGPIESIATLLDDMGNLDAVGWFEQERRRFKLEAYGENEDAMREAIGAIAIVAPDIEAKYGPLEAQDWVRMSLEGLPPVPVRRFRLVGSHDKRTIRNGIKEIVIDAGEAFGTGHHGTTAGCLVGFDHLLRQGHRPKNVLDVGAGSNVLSMAAALMGAKALATEIDARAAEIGAENCKINHLDKRVTTKVANGIRRANIRARAPFDLIFANILRKPLIKLSPDLSGVLAKGGHVIVSGLLTFQEPSVRRAYRGRGLNLVYRYRQDNWSTLVFKKPS